MLRYSFKDGDALVSLPYTSIAGHCAIDLAHVQYELTFRNLRTITLLNDLFAVNVDEIWLTQTECSVQETKTADSEKLV